MLVGSRRKAETWVHSFSVDNETRKYKSFTVYRITSIVFPRSAPEALTRVILWKRFSEVKKLYKELVRRHRERHLTGTVPELTEQSYFKRFDPSIIEQRKRYILRLLEFAGQEPILYRSHAFVSFFARGISVDDEDDSPVPIATAIEAEENGKPERVTTGGRSVNGGGGASDTAAKGNIETIRQQLGIRRPVELSLVDPRRDVTIETTPCCSSTSGGEGEEDEDELDGSETPQPAPALTAASEADGCSSSGSLIGSETGSLARETSEEEAAAAAAMDYLVDAAIVFSKAVEAEANGDYKEAFERYKAGIDRLLSGAKDDANVTRRRIAKEKSCKYVSKAEEIYERHLREDEGQGNCAGEQPELSPISPDDPSSPIQLLERPLNYLSRYKVVKVIGTVMQVQDVTDKQFYIMKSIRRPLPSSAGGLPVPSAAVFPQDVPYMVPLVAYFQSTDGCIFLLLRLVCAGKLWDFIRSYRKPPTERYCATPPSEDGDGELLESGEVVPREEDREADPRGVVDRCDAGFLNLIQEYSNSSNATRGPVGEQRKEEDEGAQQQLEHSTLNKTEEWASERSTVAMDATDDGAFDTDEIGTEAHPDGDDETVELESEERRGSIEADAPVVPSFDVLSQDMDVQELLSCSQQLLKVVAQTLEESSDQAAELESAREEGEQRSKVVESSNSIAGDHQELEEAAVDGRVNSKSHSSQLALAKTAGRTTSINDNDGRPSSKEWPNGMQQGCTGDLLPEGVVRRWISELVIAVDALHFNGIVCGDLTMDNLLLGPEGQLMLTYFHRRGESFFNQQAMTTGSSVTVAPKQSAIRGLYVAPERPLEPRSDYWSVGVIMFELLTKRSFVACHPSGVFCYHEVQYPEGVEVSSEARELLEGLLQPDVERRYDFKRIIASPFFRSVDWSEVKQRGHHSWERVSRGKRL
ncbi:ribosomal protein S6 kinase delta-1 [Anopheles aquasalis]|uniref:ribosomal protein S6 kinase delta-1 n=1 Tax=Anopheles aquasalis TaxID=42839 RepID=UPI00215B6349|nr:ribosomal protein S6 kinase delta-1 [Anopheles aquasalis]